MSSSVRQDFPPILAFIIFLFSYQAGSAQVSMPEFGKGLQITALDTSVYLKVGFRFQTLYTGAWETDEDGYSNLKDFQSGIFLRRSRLKFDGWAIDKRLKYKAELALSNRDNGGGNSSFFSNAANIILDAYVQYELLNGFSVRVGQFKLPGNRERVISSGNLQFVDRSRLNSRYTLDRDVGIMLINEHGNDNGFLIKEMFAMSSGEGKNITSGNIGGSGYTFRLEAFPFGKFRSKGDYIGSAIAYESQPKLALGLTYDINDRAGRERGQKGSFVTEGDLKSLYTWQADLMFKYRMWSAMVEYSHRRTDDDVPQIVDPENFDVVGTYYTGEGLNVAIGYMLPKTWELAARLTRITPDSGVAKNETQYTFGLNKFIVGHKFKIQGDITFRSIDGANNNLIYRLQMDFHL